MKLDNPKFIKHYPLHGKVKVVYENYNFVSHRPIRQYYTNPYYKRMIDYLYDTLCHPYSVRMYRQVIPEIESLSVSKFGLLVKLVHDDKIDVFINLIKIAAKA